MKDPHMCQLILRRNAIDCISEEEKNKFDITILEIHKQSKNTENANELNTRQKSWIERIMRQAVCGSVVNQTWFIGLTNILFTMHFVNCNCRIYERCHSTCLEKPEI